MLSVSVIVVNYNCITTLNACIVTILRSNAVEEVLLIDNASTDGSMETIEHHIDRRLKIIRLKKNIGLAAARNLAAIKAKCNTLAITDADIAVDNRWLEYPCLLLDQNKDFGAVQCNIILHNDISKIAAQIMESKNTEPIDASEENKKAYYDCLFPVGAAFVIKREVWNRIKGFDSAFFIGNDDIDFGIRLWTSGYRVVASCKGTVYHKFGTLRSQKKISPIFQFYGLRNMLMIYIKNLQVKSFLKYVLPFTLLYPFMAFRYGRLLGIRGIISVLRNLPSVLTKRSEVQRLRRIPDDTIIPMMSENGTLPINLLINDVKLLSKKLNLT